MVFWLDRFRRDDEEDIWEELKRMYRNPPSQEEIELKRQQEQAKIDEFINKMFPDEPEPQKEPYLTYEELFSPKEIEKQRQKQLGQNNLSLNNELLTGFAAPINQNKQGGLIGNAKDQQAFNNPTNLANQNNNLVQGFGNSLTQGMNSSKKQNTFTNLNETRNLSNNSKLVPKKNKNDELKPADLNAINILTSNFDKEGEKNFVLSGEVSEIGKSLNQDQCINNDIFFENERNKNTSIMMKINGKLNSGRPDAKLLMDIALIKPKNVPACNDYQFISSIKTKDLNEKYKLQGNKKIESWYDGFEFSKDAPTTQRLNTSIEFKKQILDSKNFDSKNKRFKSDKLEIEFKNDKNLQYSFGHMTLLNPKITNDGYIEGVGYDKYNYDYHYNNYKKDKNIPQDIKTILLNDSAASLQKLQHLKNYFIFIPIRIKLEEDDLL